MRIRELELRNFRVFADQPPFRFSEQFTIVAGINGRGKTAILEGLALLCSRFLPLLSSGSGGYRKMRRSELHSGAQAAELRMKLNCAGIPVDYWLRYFARGSRTTTSKLAPAVRDNVLNAYGDSSRAGGEAPLAVYYTTERAGYSSPRTLPTSLPRGLEAAYSGALLNRTVNFRDFMARYRTAITLQSGESLDNPGFLGKRTVEAISAALVTFLGGFGNLHVQEKPARLLVNKEGIALDLTQLSDGERAFLALVCDLGRRLTLANPLLANPLEGAGVVLIDELELHLHPKWQLEVVEKLRTTFPQIQFIVTTHSPFIIQTAREGEVLKLDGDLAVEPAGRTLEEVARLVMDVTNTERSPRYQSMLDTARSYLALVDEARLAQGPRKEQIQAELVRMLAPFTDNPAYTALLERRGLLE